MEIEMAGSVTRRQGDGVRRVGRQESVLLVELPDQDLIQTQVNVQSLTVEAVLTGRRDHVLHAAMLDLAPKVVRTDAIQAFVKQETPLVRIACDDGSEGIASDPVQLFCPPPAGSGQIDVRLASDGGEDDKVARTDQRLGALMHGDPAGGV